MAVLKHGREMSIHVDDTQKVSKYTAVLYIYLWAVVLLLLRFSVVDDTSLAPHWEQLRNGFHSSKCLMTGGLRFNWVGRGRVGPQRGKKT